MGVLIIYCTLITIIVILVMIILFQRSMIKLRLAMVNDQVQLLEKHLIKAQNNYNHKAEERDKYFMTSNTAESKLEALENIESRIMNVLEPIKEQLAKLDGSIRK
jgi:hypothetical protein